MNEFHNDLIGYKTRTIELEVTRWFPL